MTRHRRIDRLAIPLAGGVLIAAAVFLVNWWQASRRSAHVLEHGREYSEWKALTAKSLAQEHADAAGQFEECLKQTATARRGCLTDQATWYSRYGRRAVEQLKAIESHFAAQRMAKDLRLTTIIIVTLALGIAANSIIFSAVRAVVLRPLPYQQPERLVQVRKSGLRSGGEADWVAFPNFRDWRAANRVFALREE